MNLKALFFPTDYFEWLLRFFKLFGLYSPKDYKRKIIYYIFYFPHVTLTMSSIILDFLNVVLNRETFQRKMLNVGVLSMHTAAGLRILNWFWTKEKFEEVIDVIRRPNFEFQFFVYEKLNRITEHKR